MNGLAEKPVLLLDVDGVLLLHADSNSGFEMCPPYYCTYPGTPYVFYNPKLAAPLRALLQTMEGFYVSAHRERANSNVQNVLSLPDLEWISPTTMRDPILSDTDPLDEYFPDRPIVWVDDAFQDDHFTRASERTARGSRTLLVLTDPNRGIEECHFGEINQWLGHLSLEV